MYIAERTRKFMRGFMKSYGPSSVKKRLWDEEFSGPHWDFIDNTAGDCVYPYLEKYAAHGSVLDLGCGPGNTANEMSAMAYESYVGVDISEAALRKATKRTVDNGRSGKNTFEFGDFISYVPSQPFDLILFRESMYHIPAGKVKSTLDRYSKYLKKGGVFVVRFVLGAGVNSSRTKVDIIEAGFDIVEKQQHGEPTILVFRPR